MCHGASAMSGMTKAQLFAEKKLIGRELRNNMTGLLGLPNGGDDEGSAERVKVGSSEELGSVPSGFVPVAFATGGEASSLRVNVQGKEVSAMSFACVFANGRYCHPHARARTSGGSLQARIRQVRCMRFCLPTSRRCFGAGGY